MPFGDWLSGLGSGFMDLFGGGGGGGAVAAPASNYAGELAGGSYGPLISEPTGDGGGGFWASLGGGLSDLGSIAKTVAPIAQLGATGMGIYGGIKSMQQGAEQMDVLKAQQKQQQQMAAPAAQSGGALTQAGASALTGGALPPGLEAQVENFKNEARARYRQYLASIGQTDSSAAGQMESWVENQAMMLRNQLAGNLYQGGLSGIQTALGPSTTAAQTAMGVVGGTQGSLEQANKALAELLGSS